jgi:cell surface protein SprA
MHTAGWGSLESHIGQRALDNFKQFDASMAIDAGKPLPSNARLSIPVFASFDRTVSSPKYDPCDLAITLSQKLCVVQTKAKRDSIKNAAIDQTTIKTINFTNVRIMPKGRIRLLSLSNFDVSYSFTQTVQNNPTTLLNNLVKWRAGLGYTYNAPPKYKEPFKKIINGNSQWTAFLRDFNINLRPSKLSFRADINSQFGQYIPRIINTDQQQIKVLTVDTTVLRCTNNELLLLILYL